MMDLTNERMKFEGLSFEDDGNVWVRLYIGGMFVGEVMGATTGEAESAASQIAARWNAVADAVADLEPLNLASTTPLNYLFSKARDILRAAMFAGR